MKSSLVPLPMHWPKNVKSAVISVVSLANFTIHCFRGWADDSSNTKARMLSQIEALESEVALQKEELRIKDMRWESVRPSRRSHFAPQQRFEILQLEAARGWTIAQTARVFQVSETTVASWQKRLDEAGSAALAQMAEAINKFPELVWQIVRTLKSLCPALGKVKIAETLVKRF